MNFEQIWNAYPSGYPCKNEVGDPNFPNQCAIRLGVALSNGGVDLSNCSAVKCWHGHGGEHILRAEELASWLDSETLVFGPTEIRSNVDALYYTGRQGIMLCRNFWGDYNEGDHIDLWNKNHMAHGTPNYIFRSEEVWFWELKSPGDGIA